MLHGQDKSGKVQLSRMKDLKAKLINFAVRFEVNKIIGALLSIYGGLSLSYLLNLMATPQRFTQSLFCVALFALVFLGVKHVSRDWSTLEDVKLRRRIRYVLLFGFLLGLAMVLGYQIRIDGLTSPGVKGKLFILLVSGGISVALSPFINMWFRLLERKKAADAESSASEGSLPENKSARTFLISWGVIVLCWIPVFLAYYPAIMSYDFNRQVQEAYKGYIWFNTHHPLIHTFLIRCALLLGEAMGSYEAGMAIFSILQMLVLSAVMAYSCSMIGRIIRKRWPIIVSIVLFAILPVHPVMALCMTKDILFSAFFLLLMLLVLERKQCRNRRILLDVAMVLTGILVIMFRNNAVYAFAVFAVFYVLWSRKERIHILLLCMLILAGGLGAKTAMQTAMDAGSGSKIEMYSVFVQQMARVGKNQEQVLTAEQWETIEKYVPYDSWKDYNPTIADGIKSAASVYTFELWKDDIPGMLKDWATIGISYPNDYLDAFLALTSGYWFPDDVSNAEVMGVGEDWGLIYTFNVSAGESFEGVEEHSFLPGLLELYSEIVNGNGYDNWPVLSNFFKPATYCWILFTVMISLLYLKEPKKLVLCMLPFWYLMTLLLGPVVNIRYVYPIMIAAPFLIAWLFSTAGWNCENSSEDCIYVLLL